MRVRSTLNRKLQGLLEFIIEYIEENGRFPTQRVVCDHLGATSPGTAIYYLEILRRSGYITVDYPRSMRVLRDWDRRAVALKHVVVDPMPDVPPRSGSLLDDDGE